MTIRKQWLISLIIVAICIIFINSMLLKVLIDKNFVSYMTDTYNKNVDNIKETVIKTVDSNNFDKNELKVRLESYLDDPIIGINIYDEDGREIVSVGTTINSHSNMMNHMKMMEKQREEVDSFSVGNECKDVGKINIIKYSSIEASFASQIFKQTLLLNILIVGVIVLAIAVIISFYMSKKMGDELKKTESLARNISLGDDEYIHLSKIKEIKFIQMSLIELRSKLKIKRKSRKQLLDELIHQTRTPLTIIKTHLEGYQDGVIDLGDKEIKICEEQIEHVALIISNMSGLIEGEKDKEEINIEQFDILKVLKQISNGLKAQFKKKSIEFQFLENEEIYIITDKYKFSQAVYNILTNAYKFTNVGGKVTLTYSLINNIVKIKVRDNGIGISKEDMKNIFNAYYRGSKSSNISGDGIGLYVVLENIKSLGGTISVDSKEDIFSEFIIEIPIMTNI